MHGEMRGHYEIRLTGPGRDQFRLFCVLDNGSDEQLAEPGLYTPAIAVICGLRKPWRTTFTAADYADVRRQSDAYRTQIPRRIAT